MKFIINNYHYNIIHGILKLSLKGISFIYYYILLIWHFSCINIWNEEHKGTKKYCFTLKTDYSSCKNIVYNSKDLLSNTSRIALLCNEFIERIDVFWLKYRTFFSNGNEIFPRSLLESFACLIFTRRQSLIANSQSRDFPLTLCEFFVSYSYFYCNLCDI